MTWQLERHTRSRLHPMQPEISVPDGSQGQRTKKTAGKAGGSTRSRLRAPHLHIDAGHPYPPLAHLDAGAEALADLSDGHA